MQAFFFFFNLNFKLQDFVEYYETLIKSVELRWVRNFFDEYFFARVSS